MRPLAWLTFAIALLNGLFAPLRASDELTQRLKRIYDSDAFRQKLFGPARWIRGGKGFTTLEPSIQTAGAQDIIEYETATGKRTILVPAALLKPPKAE